MNNKIIMEDSFQTLYNNTLNKFSTDRDDSSKRVQIITTAYIPSLNNASLEARAKTKTNNGTYDSIIYLENVEYVEEDVSNAISFMAPDGAEYYIIPVSRDNNMKVNCTCLDFYWSFSLWNDNKDSLFGDPPAPYVKKTNRLPKNPTKSAGFCKHLLKFSNVLILEKIIR